MKRRVYTVTGAQPEEAQLEGLIETGHAEAIFQQAIQQQGRGGQVVCRPDQQSAPLMHSALSRSPCLPRASITRPRVTAISESVSLHV